LLELARQEMGVLWNAMKESMYICVGYYTYHIIITSSLSII